MHPPTHPIHEDSPLKRRKCPCTRKYQRAHSFFPFCFGPDFGKLAEPSHQTVLERILGIRNQSSPVLRLSHSSVWWCPVRGLVVEQT